MDRGDPNADSLPHSHFLFHASFVPLIALHTDRLSPNRAAWEDDVDRARAVLQSLRDDPLAERCLKIIELLAPPRGPQSLETGFDGSQLAEMFHGNEMWLGSGFGQDDLAQTLSVCLQQRLVTPWMLMDCVWQTPIR